jgi:hypothetical protein
MTVLDQSLGTVEEKLEGAALEVAARRTRETLASEAFLEAADSSVQAVLRQDALSLPEVAIFKAV